MGDADPAPAALFARRRNDADLVLLQGLHALKHALRFGADIEVAVTDDPDRLHALIAELCPDLAGGIDRVVRHLPAADFRALAGTPAPASPVLALARRPPVAVPDVLRETSGAPVVLLDDPRHAGNAGAVVRVAAAADARAVLMTGDLDPWSPAVVRAAAGLHFAVDVGRAALPLRTRRALVAFDPGGDPFDPAALPAGAVLAFGSERHGLSTRLLQQAELVWRIPMRAQVSSLNLATSVAAVLYCARYAAPPVDS